MKIEPALTAEEWAKASAMDEDDLMQAAARCVQPIGTVHDARRAIAALNHALPDDDPRKITRQMVDHIRNQIREQIGNASPDFSVMDGIADALRSYLPPDP